VRRSFLGGLTLALLVILLLCVEMVLRFGPWEIEPALRLHYEALVASNVAHKGAFRHIHMRDNDLFWKGRPNTKWTGRVGRDIPAEMNSHGFRQREFSMTKPASTFRIVCLGDSRTFGLGVWEEETYPRQLERLLHARRREDRDVQVLNLGIMGYTMFQGWISLNIHVPQMQPDVVTFAFGFNDMLPAEHPDSVFYENGHGWLGRLKQFLRKSKLFVIYEKLVLRMTREVTKKPEPHILRSEEEMVEEVGYVQIGGELVIENRRVDKAEHAELVLKAIAFCKKRGIVPVMISIPQASLKPPYIRTPAYHQAVVSICKEHQAAVVDLFPAFAEFVQSGEEETRPDRVRMLLSGVCHPTARGNSLIAEEIARQLESLGVLPQ